MAWKSAACWDSQGNALRWRAWPLDKSDKVCIHSFSSFGGMGNWHWQLLARADGALLGTQEGDLDPLNWVRLAGHPSARVLDGVSAVLGRSRENGCLPKRSQRERVCVSESAKG